MGNNQAHFTQISPESCIKLEQIIVYFMNKKFNSLLDNSIWDCQSLSWASSTSILLDQKLFSGQLNTKQASFHLYCGTLLKIPWFKYFSHVHRVVHNGYVSDLKCGHVSLYPRLFSGFSFILFFVMFARIANFSGQNTTLVPIAALCRLVSWCSWAP